MSDENKTLWVSIKEFFSNLTIKVKVVVGALLSFIGLISVFLFAKKINQRKILELELKKVRKKIEIENTQKEIDKNSQEISSLKEEEKVILEQIKKLDEIEPRDDVSKEELDDFFDKRGF